MRSRHPLPRRLLFECSKRPKAAAFPIRGAVAVRRGLYFRSREAGWRAGLPPRVAAPQWCDRLNRVLKTLLVFCAVLNAADVTVTGPIASKSPGDPSHDYPFYAALQDLKSRGYVEQEFFIEGAANRYETPAAENGKIIDSG